MLPEKGKRFPARGNGRPAESRDGLFTGDVGSGADPGRYLGVNRLPKDLRRDSPPAPPPSPWRAPCAAAPVPAHSSFLAGRRLPDVNEPLGSKPTPLTHSQPKRQPSDFFMG
jgi:hypothetical protein